MIIIIAYLAEFLGVVTGFPFGNYVYSNMLKLALFGIPIIIPFAWFMMLIPSWSVAYLILTHYYPVSKPKFMIFFSILSALVFTAWDFYLDPQMVTWGVWKWAPVKGYFGIPWQNFLGWFFVSALITMIIQPYDIEQDHQIRKGLMIYTITWAFQSVGLAVFWHQPLPAIVGFLSMGFFCVWAWVVSYKKWTLSSDITSR